MIENQLAVLQRCKYYDDIMNAGYEKNDFITDKLISGYQDFLFQVQTEKEIKTSILLDKILFEYLTSRHFCKFVKQHYLEENKTSFDDITSLISIYYNYIQQEIKNRDETKWI